MEMIREYAITLGWIVCFLGSGVTKVLDEYRSLTP